MPKISHFSPVHRIPGTRNLELAESILLGEAILNGGMTLDFDPADIPNNKSPMLVNARVRRDKTSRRAGKAQFLADTLNTRQVSAIIPFRLSGRTTYFVKTTDFDVHFVDNTAGSVWTILTGGPLASPFHTLGGRVTDHAIVLGKLILADGISRLRLVDLNTEKVTDLGEIAPTARYVTGFSERVVAANNGMGDAASETVSWSGNRNLTEFDALEDISAGNQRLDTSPRTVVDPISGIFGFSSVMVIPRESSIWLATQNPVASDPFKFFRSVPGVGTNLSGSIAVGRELLMFLDSRMRDIVIYRPGQNIETIGIAVRNSIIKDIIDADIVDSTYLTSEQEYHLLITEKDIVKIWVFNFITQAWTYDEVPNATALGVVDEFTEYTSFDELSGTFDAQVGTFDELSVTPSEIPTLVYGFDDGNIAIEDDSRELDFREDIPLGATYLFELQSKEFKSQKQDITVTRIELEYQSTADGFLTLEFSKDGGRTWILAKKIATLEGKVQLLKFKKQIRTRRLRWRVLATDGRFDLLGFEIDAAATGESRN